MVLDTPIGNPEFVKNILQQLAIKQQKLLEAIPDVPNLQSAWLLLSHCAAARANYYLRVLNPNAANEYAQWHDDAIWGCFKKLLDISLDHADDNRARTIAQLPLRYGGLGLRSAQRVSPAAYWASWADSLPMIRERHPHAARIIQETLSNDNLHPDSMMGQVNMSARHLQACGFARMPTWHALSHGLRPEQLYDREPGEW